VRNAFYRLDFGGRLELELGGRHVRWEYLHHLYLSGFRGMLGIVHGRRIVNI